MLQMLGGDLLHRSTTPVSGDLRSSEHCVGGLMYAHLFVCCYQCYVDARGETVYVDLIT